MPLLFRYESTNNNFPDMGNDDFRFGEVTLSQNAQIGEAAISTLLADDPDGTLNYIGYRIFSARETSAPSNQQLIYRGRLARRTVRRNPQKGLITGAAREWELEIADQNVLLGWRFFMSSSANRPAETASDRLNWLVATRRVPMYAHPTYCSAPATAMDAADYRQQRVGDVLADIATATGYNFWCDYDEGRERTELFFMDPNSTDYASTIRISNDIDDYDGSTTFYPSIDAELTRDPSRVAASILTTYPTGYVYETRDSTGDQFAYVDQVAPVGNVKSRAKAAAITTRLLNQHDEEDDRISVSIDLPAAQVNDVRHGQVMDVKFSHLPGYEDFTPCRVAKRSMQQLEEIGQSVYRVRLELSPTGASTPPSSVDWMYAKNPPGTWSLEWSPASGDTILVLGAKRDGWNSPFQTLKANSISGPNYTIIEDHGNAGLFSDGVIAAYRTSDGTDTAIENTSGGSAADLKLAAIGLRNVSSVTSDYDQGSGSTTLTGPGVTAPTAGAPAIIYGLFAQAGDDSVTFSAATGWSILVTDNTAGTENGFHPHVAVVYKSVTEASGSYTPQITSTDTDHFEAITVVVQ